MNKETKKIEKNKLQTRREFFKIAAKKTLPIIGAIVVASTPTFAQVSKKEAMGCDDGCYNSCRGGCHGCQGDCQGSCSGSCGNNCSGLCQDNCYTGCKGSSRRLGE